MPKPVTTVAAVFRQAIAAQRASADALEAALALIEGDRAVPGAAPDDLLRLAEGAEWVSSTPRALRARIRSGKLAATRSGRDYLVRRGDLLALFAPKLRTPLAVVRPARTMTEDERIAASLADAGITRRRTA